MKRKTTNQTAYEILGIPKTATAKIIRHAFIEKGRDIVGINGGSAIDLELLKEAKRILLSDSRKKYDEKPWIIGVEEESNSSSLLRIQNKNQGDRTYNSWAADFVLKIVFFGREGAGKSFLRERAVKLLEEGVDPDFVDPNFDTSSHIDPKFKDQRFYNVCWTANTEGKDCMLSLWEASHDKNARKSELGAHNIAIIVIDSTDRDTLVHLKDQITDALSYSKSKLYVVMTKTDQKPIQEFYSAEVNQKLQEICNDYVDEYNARIYPTCTAVSAKSGNTVAELLIKITEDYTVEHKALKTATGYRGSALVTNGPTRPFFSLPSIFSHKTPQHPLDETDENYKNVFLGYLGVQIARLGDRSDKAAPLIQMQGELDRAMVNMSIIKEMVAQLKQQLKIERPFGSEREKALNQLFDKDNNLIATQVPHVPRLMIKH